MINEKNFKKFLKNKFYKKEGCRIDISFDLFVVLLDLVEFLKENENLNEDNKKILNDIFDSCDIELKRYHPAEHIDIYCWTSEKTMEEVRNGAYWERNMLALFICSINDNCGFYEDRDNNFPGWLRVISLFNGQFCFHVPDSFKIPKTIKQISPDWDGHTTIEKWKKMREWITNG